MKFSSWYEMKYSLGTVSNKAVLVDFKNKSTVLIINQLSTVSSFLLFRRKRIPNWSSQIEEITPSFTGREAWGQRSHFLYYTLEISEWGGDNILLVGQKVWWKQWKKKIARNYQMHFNFIDAIRVNRWYVPNLRGIAVITQ